MINLLKTAALGLAATGVALTAVPAAAADLHRPGYHAAPQEDGWDRNRRDRHRDRDRYRGSRGYDDRYGGRYAYGEPVYRNTQVWRGRDGSTYCRKKDGTTGLIIGGAAGALIGREVDGGRSRTLGTILGAAAGALIGKELTDGTRCR
ncbi:MAG TPA: glycine zipper 2TM domain-containing protein [Croceibacterium sp.]|nr:glycine zipper 2TM domain-containing protein [Croceibacterium sp.]